MANRYWVGGTGNWSDDTNHWATSSGGSPGTGNLPTSSDDVFINSSSGFGSGGTITTESYDSACNNLTCNSGHTFTITGTYLGIFGSTIFESGLTVSLSGVGFRYVSNVSLTCNNAIIECVLDFGSDITDSTGVLTLQDDLVTTSTFQFNEGTGTFDANDHNVTANNFYFYADTDYTPTVIMGSGTWEATGTGDVLTISENNAEVVTITPETSTIKITNASSSSKTFIGGGKTYNNLWLSGTGTGEFIITGSNTFNDLKADTPPHTVKLTDGTTTTVTTFTVSGTSGNLITLDTDTGTGQFTLSKSSGTVSCDYLDLSNSNATGGATWYAGSNSADTANNDGWIFEDAPVVTTTQTSGRNSINGINSLTSLCALG